MSPTLEGEEANKFARRMLEAEISGRLDEIAKYEHPNKCYVGAGCAICQDCVNETIKAIQRKERKQFAEWLKSEKESFIEIANNCSPRSIRILIDEKIKELEGAD